MYITKDNKTEDYFHRFSKVEVNNMPWEVQAVDSMSLDGVIIVALKETYQNSIEKEINKNKEENPVIPTIDETVPYISGNVEISPYDTVRYQIKKLSEEELTGDWEVTGKKINILEKNSEYIVFQENSGRQGKIEIKYIREEEADISLSVEVKSL
jgi:hypothetical protein